MRLCFLFLLIKFNYSQDCRVCHKTQKFDDNLSQNVILKWSRARDITKRKGHIWITTEVLQKHLTVSATVETSQSSFYETLTKLSEAIKVDGGNHEVIRKFRKLLNDARNEVPVYNHLWDLGHQLLDKSRGARKIEIENFQKVLEFSFLHLYLRNHTEYKFEAQSRVKVSKILLFFGGFDRRSNIDFSLHNDTFSANSYRGIFKSTKLSQPRNEIVADYKINTSGDLVSLIPKNSPLSAANVNMAGFLSRGKIDLQSFTGKKIIYLGRHKGLRKDRIKLEMKMHPGDVYLRNETPMLKVNYDLREIESDRGDRLNLYGSGSVFLSVDGLMNELVSRVNFQVKLFNMGLINGFSEDKISLTSIKPESFDEGMKPIQ